MLIGKYNKWSPVLPLVRKKHFAATGDFWAKAILCNLPTRSGSKPGGEGLHAGAPDPWPQEQATFLVGRDSVHMSTGTVPRCFPILPVITIGLETARQEGPRMFLLQWPAEHSPPFWPPGFSREAATLYKLLWLWRSGSPYSHFIFSAQLKCGLRAIFLHPNSTPGSCPSI